MVVLALVKKIGAKIASPDLHQLLPAPQVFVAQTVHVLREVEAELELHGQKFVSLENDRSSEEHEI